MNKLFSKIAGLSIGLAMAIGVGIAVASNKEATPVEAATGTYTIGWGASGTDATFASTSGTVTFAAGHTASFATAKNSSGNAPAYNANNKQLRLYYASNGSGGSVTFTCSNVTITGFTLTSATSPTLKYSVNGGTAETLTTNNKTYTASGLSATSSLMFQNGNTTNTQLQISTIAFTYSYSSDPVKLTTPSPSYNDTTKQVSWADVSNASSYQVKVDSGSYATATSPYDVSGLTTGTSHTVYVIAKGDGTNFSDSDAGSETFTPTAPKVLSSISVSGQTTTFDQGDTWIFGGTVTAHYEDETTADVTSLATFSGYDTSTVGSQTVTVSYGNKTTTYSITVNKVLSVTFVAGTDTGSTSVTKGGITVSMSTMSRDDNYRCYANTAISISSSGSNIDSIVFTFSSDSYTGGFNTSYLSVGSTSWSSGNANGQARITEIVVTLESSDPSAELAPTSASSVSIMRGDTDTSVKVLVKNIESPSWTFTYDEGGNTGLSSSANINVSAGALDSDNISTLTITTKNNGSTGTTTLHISVSDGENDYDVEDTVAVTVNAKPASMTIVHGDIVAGELEIQTSLYKQVSFSGEDTDGNSYAIAAADVTGSITSGSSYVSLSGTRITGTAEGTAVVRYTLNALTSVYAEVTVNVVDDYNATVNTITFNSNLTATQGDAVDTSEVFSTKTANTHFGSTATIADSELLFSYENDRSDAEAIGVFSYDFSHGTTVDSTHKTQTVYVFTSFDSTYAGSFSITVEQKNDPLTAITITNVTENAVDIARGSTFQLEIAYTPTNPTDGKEVNYRVDDYDAGVSISVNSSGLISVSASSGLGEALIIVESAHDDTIYDWVDVSVVLESMTYTINEAESWTKVTTVAELTSGGTFIMGYESGDEIVPLRSDGAGATTTANGVFYTGTSDTPVANDGGTIIVSTSLEHKERYEVTISSPSSGVINIQLSDGNYVGATATGSTKNSGRLYSSGNSDETNITPTLSGGKFQLSVSVTGDYKYMKYNTGSPRYAFYNSGAYDTVFYKKSGGESTKNVDATLFNAIHNNFGANGTTYTWDEDCAVFNSNNWDAAGSALTGITGFASYKLNRAVANANGNEVEQFLAKYDYIISKTSLGANDFLGRFSSGGINANTRIDVNPIQLSAKNISAVIIIVVISSISIAAVGGYFLFRRRKEQ